MFRSFRFTRVIVGAVVSGLLIMAALAASAQDTPNEPLPDADPKMQDLAWFIGEWNVHSRMLMDAANDEWLEEDLRTVHTYELNGHLIFEHFFGPLGGEPFEAWSLRRYNPNSGHWEQRWVDTSPGGFANWRGIWDAETNSFTGYAERLIDAEFNLTGDRGAREIFDQITEDSFEWRFESTEDGGQTWAVTWTLSYVRAE
jgi:hypothetical protein